MKAAEASAQTLVQYAKGQGIDVRRLYEARNRLRRAATKAGAAGTSRRAQSAADAGQASGGAFIKVELKPQVVSKRDRAAQQQLTGAALAMQARLVNGVILSWMHQSGSSEATNNLVRALAGLPCSA